MPSIHSVQIRNEASQKRRIKIFSKVTTPDHVLEKDRPEFTFTNTKQW